MNDFITLLDGIETRPNQDLHLTLMHKRKQRRVDKAEFAINAVGVNSESRRLFGVRSLFELILSLTLKKNRKITERDRYLYRCLERSLKPPNTKKLQETFAFFAHQHEMQKIFAILVQLIVLC